MKQNITKHHLYPRHGEGSDRIITSDPLNISRLLETPHVNHHRVFQNKHPQEQILQVLDFNKPILNKQILKMREHIANMLIEEFYIDMIIK